MFSSLLSSSSSLLLSIVAIVCCLLCKCCTSAPHPCCPGSQHVVSLMSQHIDTLSYAQSKSALCSNAQRVADALKNALSTISCPYGGDRTLVAQIEQNLSTTTTSADECAMSLGFVRTMFAIAASASSHVGNDSKWGTLSAQFGQQVTIIKQKCAEFNIGIGHVPVDSPKGVHGQQNVPAMDNVLAFPAEMGSHKQ